MSNNKKGNTISALTHRASLLGNLLDPKQLENQNVSNFNPPLHRNEVCIILYRELETKVIILCVMLSGGLINGYIHVPDGIKSTKEN